MSTAKRHRAVVQEKQPTFQQRAQQASKVQQAPKKLPTANELILLHEICIREINAKLEKMENEIKLLKNESNKIE
jgi:hypothetical protein